MFRQAVRQITWALDRALVAEMAVPEPIARNELHARPLKLSQLSLADRERNVARHVGATQALFGPELIWSFASDAVRSGFVNRQNTAFFTALGVGAWGLPQVPTPV